MSIKQIIVALDQMDEEEIDQFLSHSENSLTTIKIGLELFLKYGPELIVKIHKLYNKKIFLDLKLHDIPKTVERAVHSLENLPIDFLTVHLSGGEEMLCSALRQAQKSLPVCKILGVSFLTSLEEKDLSTLFGITNTREAFLKLFKVAHVSGIDGVVCSPHEIILLKKHYPHLLAVTPGIRFSDEILQSQVQDQKRVASAKEAIQLGADFLVIGRSLTQAKDLASRLKELEN
jgi:orotidine-5'-phosphate decarboxylase